VTTLDELGQAVEVESDLSVEQARRWAAALDHPERLDAGTDLPLPWHWGFFTPTTATADLGADGHPAITSARLHGLRRMWAGGRLVRARPLVVGRRGVRRTELVSVLEKDGRSGRLLFVTLRHVVEQDGEVALVEEQDLVYRGPGTVPAPGPARPVEVPAGGWSVERVFDVATLFRFSAVTFNSHRIHYDREYATRVEGYPDLVVHGPLLASVLARSAEERLGPATTFEFRAEAPCFPGTPVTVVGERLADGAARLQALRVDGVVAMTARHGISTEVNTDRS
jgi:3-methylfumaryl-CoA hydratase